MLRAQTTSILGQFKHNKRIFAVVARNMSSSYTTVSDAIKADHRELESYYKNFCDAKTNDKKEEWRNQFVWELARHSIGEELVVYPAFEKYLGTKGEKLADTDRKEHQTVKEELYKLQNTSVEDSTTLRQLFDTLMTDLTDHIKHEESNDLPALEKQLKQEESQSMAASFERTKQFVPTRSHPSAPDKPPFETVVGLLAAPMDKLRDLFTRFPDEKS